MSVIKDSLSLDESFYAEITKLYRDSIKKAKRNYLDKHLVNASNKSKAAWDVINTCSGCDRRSPLDISIKTESTLITSQKEVADMFNNYFGSNIAELRKSLQSNIYANEPDQPHTHSSQPNTTPSNVMFLRPLRIREFYDIVDKVCKKKIFRVRWHSV